MGLPVTLVYLSELGAVTYGNVEAFKEKIDHPFRELGVDGHSELKPSKPW